MLRQCYWMGSVPILASAISVYANTTQMQTLSGNERLVLNRLLCGPGCRGGSSPFSLVDELVCIVNSVSYSHTVHVPNML